MFTPFQQALLEKLDMQTRAIEANTVALAKPRPRRPSVAARWRKAEADYLAKCEQEENAKRCEGEI